ncbi:MAG: substrate-binding domain-containing protein [Caldicoprobacterales bacterium]
MVLNVVIEPSYHGTYWCKQYVYGVRMIADRSNIILNEISDDNLSSLEYESTDERKICLLIGTSVRWIHDMILSLNKMNVHVILVACHSSMQNGVQISSVTTDYWKSMQNLMTYLLLSDRKRIALFGINPNSTNDLIKKEAFMYISFEGQPHYASEDIFTNKGSLNQACQDFFQKIDAYDSVICANDISAITLIRFLKTKYVQVPDDIYIVSFGDTVLGQIQYPSITTAVLNCVEIGKQAVEIFLMLRKNTCLSSITTTVECQVKVGESTANRPAPGELTMVYSSSNHEQVPFYDDPDVAEIFQVEEALSHCDELDLKIISGLMQNIAYGALSEILYISESALKYRVKKLLSYTGGIKRSEFVDLLNKYLDVERIINYSS